MDIFGIINLELVYFIKKKAILNLKSSCLSMLCIFNVIF